MDQEDNGRAQLIDSKKVANWGAAVLRPYEGAPVCGKGDRLCAGITFKIAIEDSAAGP